MKTSDDSGAGRILVVEDDQRIARDLALVLRTLGFTVTGLADTATRAIDEVEANPPDLVLMDITLAGRRDGITAANEIRKRFGIPSIYLTAYSDEETLSRAEVTEPLGFLLKPFNDRELYTVIRVALYRRKMESLLHEAKEKLRTMSGLLQVCASCNWACLDLRGLPSYLRARTLFRFRSLRLLRGLRLLCAFSRELCARTPKPGPQYCRDAIEASSASSS